MKLSKIFLVFYFIGTLQALMGQQSPAKAQTQSILLTGATIHTGTGTVIRQGAIGFEKGKIRFIGKENIPKNFDQIIDVSGKHIYPGFIAPNTQLGLREISAVRATADFVEVETFNPSVRSIIAYNTDSKVTPTVRSNGVLIAQIAPTGRTISGKSSVVHLDAWNWEDALIAEDMAMHLQWPNRFRSTHRRGEARMAKPNKNYDQQIQKITNFFEDARAYAKKQNPEQTNLKLEACRPLFAHKAKLFVHTQDAKSMIEATFLAEKLGVELVIVGAAEAYLITDFLAKHKVPLILADTHRLPRYDEEDIDQPYKLPAQLQNAGVLFAFGINGYWQQRNLPFQAGQAVAYGLGYEQAVQALTLNTAKILGIDQHLGSLEVGKDATLIVVQGDALDMRNSKVERAYITGRNIDLDNKQKALYRKFADKYGL